MTAVKSEMTIALGGGWFLASTGGLPSNVQLKCARTVEHAGNDPSDVESGGVQAVRLSIVHDFRRMLQAHEVIE
jgi:hypothetical protein